MKLRNFFFLILLYPTALYAAPKKPNKNYPYVSGDALIQYQADRVLSSEKKGIPANNGFVYVEQNSSLNFNKNWSAKMQLRLQPNNVLTTRNQVTPERYRTFLSNDRGFGLQETGILLEELKLNYENDDVRVFAGKFDPTFGTAWRKTKRIGVFASQFTEDYNLREKIGGGITALLENSSISFNSFMNDTTELSRSMISDRGRAKGSSGIAGSNGSLSSYSVSMEGENFLTVDNWYYNFGYRSLGVDNAAGRAREQGFVVGSEYLYQLGRNSSIIPFVELVKIDNFAGFKNRNAKYGTFALIGNYSSWTASVSFVTREIKDPYAVNYNDHQMQFSVGYKITDNLTVDISRADIKEDGQNGGLIGATVTYFYKF